MADNTEKQSTFQSFLNDNQYSRKSILIYERIFGHTYVSTGGQDTTEVRVTVHLLPLETYIWDFL